MKKCFLYSHGGSKNHGCEAIVRGTEKIINKRETYISESHSACLLDNWNGFFLCCVQTIFALNGDICYNVLIRNKFICAKYTERF